MSLHLEADARARARLRGRAAGRALLIDFYATRCCTSALIGDLETRWVDPAETPERIAVDEIEGVAILADRRLVPLLSEGAALVESGPVFAHTIGVRLDRPELWLAFLETPAARRRSPRPEVARDRPEHSAATGTAGPHHPASR